jgi:hypothetical protein
LHRISLQPAITDAEGVKKAEASGKTGVAASGTFTLGGGGGEPQLFEIAQGTGTDGADGRVRLVLSVNSTW